jgi:hypothetical protein
MRKRKNSVATALDISGHLYDILKARGTDTAKPDDLTCTRAVRGPIIDIFDGP